MTTFSYVALESSGKRKSGFIDANDERSAIAAVMAQGRHVVEIKKQEKSHKQKAGDNKEIRKGKTSKADLALFTRRLSDLSEAGLPLDRVLQILAEQSESEQLCRISEEALEDLKKGLSVSQALAKNPKLFSEMYTQTLRAGEASGTFPESASRLADLQENEVARRSLIVSAMIYPSILAATAVFVVIFLLMFVVPKLAGVFEGLGDDLPTPTKMLLATTDLLTQHWVEIVVVIFVVTIAMRLWLATNAGKDSRDAFILRIPNLGPIIKKAVISRYARVLGTLIKGGVPILDAIHLAGLASGNRVYMKLNGVVEADIREGRTIAGALRDAGEFPPVLTHMVAIGEETGDLPKMLSRVSDSLDFEVEHGLNRLTSMAEPVIVILMGGFVAFVVLSVLLPIFQAQDLVK